MANETPESTPSGTELAFNSIGISLWASLSRLAFGDFAAFKFALAYYTFRAAPAEKQAKYLEGAAGELLGFFQALEDNNLQSFLGNLRRGTLISAIGTFDSFLSDALRFAFLHRPDLLRKYISKKINNIDEEAAEKIVRGHMKYWSTRLDCLSEVFQVTIDELTREGLKELIELRNEIAHHTGMYRFAKDSNSGRVYAKSRRVPEVTSEQSQKSQVLVGEVTDKVYTAMSQALFSRLPSVRALTADVAAVHAEWKAAWLLRANKSKTVEEIPDPAWMVLKLPDSDYICVADRQYTFTATPTNIEPVPALFSSIRNKKHGTDTIATVDTNPPQSLHGKELLEQLLTGKSLLIEYHEEHAEYPRFARYPLKGFREAWERACRLKVESDSIRT